ncbi:MAG TPA: (d)CMP kinase [Stellaceae bacterium]|nr:(d)CMP kinase [Stellaceae bacterium]
MDRAFVIAIDGPAASGKGTLARKLAARFDLAHLDSGALYRAVGRDTIAAGHDPGDAKAAAEAARRLDPATLGDPALRGEVAGRAASVVAAHPSVRAALLDFQRAFAARPPGAVLDGRDIGTVVCPNADVKLFVVADVAARAERRFKELQDKGDQTSCDAVLADLMNRDARDSERVAAPLKPAEDSVLLDTTELDIDQAFAAAAAIVEARRAAGS